MSKPAGLSAISRPDALQPKTIPKSLVFIFVLAQFFFGIDYGFFATVTSKRLRALAYFCSVLNVLIIETAFAYNFAYNSNYLDPVLAVYYFCVFLTMHFSKYKLRNFITDIMALDDTCNIDLNSHIGLKTSIAVVYACCFRLVISGLFCSVVKCLEGGAIYLIMYVIYESTHVFHAMLTVVNCMVFYLVNLRVFFLISAFEREEQSIKNIIIFFKSLADCLNKIRVSQDTVTLLRYVVDCITCIVFIWVHIKWIKESLERASYVFLYIDTAHIILLICLPSVVAEMVATQIDKMKWLIHERLLIETDSEKNKDMLDLLRYIEARPLTRAAWRLVPVDLRLPVSLLSMSATYLIVLVQLTHLY